MQDVQENFFSDLSFGLFRVDMELINYIYRKGTESGQHFHVEELQKTMVSDDCLENFVISNAKKEDLILKEVQNNNLSMYLEQC